MRRAIKERCKDLRAFYVDEQGRPHPPGWFENKMYELATYYNVDYGHSRKFDEILHLDKVCPIGE
ncbi:MAG: hypothetical protein Kow00105_14780 [Phycisphaeraceae bacterium]